MSDRASLPLRFDPARLADDLNRIDESEWVPHFNKRDYDGAWDAVSLRSLGGIGSLIVPSRVDHGPWAETPALERCPYYREVLAAFHCDLRTVRLMRLAPGAVIKEHSDAGLGYVDGEVRLHVPVATNPDLEFYLDNERVVMHAGECWYLDLNRPHRVTNGRATPRVHLVIDCAVNDWLGEMLTECGIDKHRAGDDAPTPIDDKDRPQIIEALRLQGTPTALELADRLEGEAHGDDSSP